MRVRLKGLNHVRKRLADGTYVDYWYAWKGGPRVHGEFGSPEFMANYYAAVEGCRRKPKTDFQSLIDRFLDSAEFAKLGGRSKADYKQYLKRIQPAFGDLPLGALSDRAVLGEFLDWRDKIAANAPAQADKAFGALARIVSWAFQRGLIKANPCQGVKKVHKGTRRDQIWTPEQEAAFMAKAPKHLQLPFQFALWTAQRRGDILELVWSDYDGEFIHLVQSKTGAPVSIAVGPTLKSVLEEAKAFRKRFEERNPPPPDQIFLTSKGNKWTGSGFSAVFRKTCDAAGIEGVTFHDLRGTCVTRLALAEATVPEIASMTGHSLKDVDMMLDGHYMKRDNGLSCSAVRKLEKQAELPTKRPTGP